MVQAAHEFGLQAREELGRVGIIVLDGIAGAHNLCLLQALDRTDHL